MGLVDNWLEGIGLGYAVPIFSAQGISSPDMLSKLDVVDFPELGISDQNDRKKLFYLIQRVRLALDRGRDSENARAEAKRVPPSSSTNHDHGGTTAPQADSAVVAKQRQPPPGAAPAAISAESGTGYSGLLREELDNPVRGGARGLVGGEDDRAATPLESAGGGGQQTPLRARQRLPSSYRRPKTPHIDASTAPSARVQRNSSDRHLAIVSDGDDAPEDVMIVRDDELDEHGESHRQVSENVQVLGARLADAEIARRSATAAAAAAANAAASATSRASAVGAYRSIEGEPTRPSSIEGRRLLMRSDSTESRRSTRSFRSARSTRSPRSVHQGEPTKTFAVGTHVPAVTDMQKSERRPRDLASSREALPQPVSSGRDLSPRASEIDRAEYDSPEPELTEGVVGEYITDGPPPTPGRDARRRPTQVVPLKSTPSRRRRDFESRTAVDRPGAQDDVPLKRHDAPLSPRVRRRAPALSPRAGIRATAATATKETRTPRLAVRTASVNVVVAQGRNTSGEEGPVSAKKAFGAARQSRVRSTEQQPDKHRQATAHEDSRQRSQSSAPEDIWGEAEVDEYFPSDEEMGAEIHGGIYADNAAVPEAQDLRVSSSSSTRAIEEVRQHAEALVQDEDEHDAIQHDAAGELAVRLISAHREDVRSALAAARKDMDLVSKADQDRHPSTLIEYAREVEGVLGERLAAAAKLRAALDNYVALRQTALGAVKVSSGKGALEKPSARAGRGVRV